MGVEACPHCSTRYVVPEDRAAVREATADARPPANVMVWAAAPEARIPDFANDPVLHRCRQGRPACVRCGAVGQVGNALLGHPPEPLICLACTKPTLGEVRGAIDELIEEGLVKRIVVDGEPRVGLTPAGEARAAQVGSAREPR